ncbi:MAG: penicillin acylase family protein [Candidatus Eremiobacteraeota bacterium]|nr:penicillin acylase family protein [Candidatus Eremiobacteraeota bacterium]
MMTPRQREDLAIELCRPVPALAAVGGRLLRHALALGCLAAAFALAYGAYVASGLAVPGDSGGTRVVDGLASRVEIVRDARDVPHVIAASERDLFEAQGYAEASDRLFQMELTRRYAYGTLSEILGAKALAIDESQRYYDVRDVAQREWQAMGAPERDALRAFSDGVNAAMQAQPLPVEFRLLLYRPQPWRPQDSLAVSLAISNALEDSWRDVLARDDVWRRVGAARFDDYFPLSDPAYDVSFDGKFDPGKPNALTPERSVALSERSESKRPRPGSNAWAAGSLRSGGAALLANDPHLDLTIPGLWYLVDLQAPRFHAAGAAIPGAPGVLLGHTQGLAWGATNGDVASASLFAVRTLDPRAWVRERFHVRWAADVVRSYYRTANEFGVPDPRSPSGIALVRPAPCAGDRSGIATFLGLDRAQTVSQALQLLASYGGAAENFVFADTGGAVGYHVAGRAVDDPAWGRYVHPAADLSHVYAAIPYALLPSRLPSRDSLVVTANNKMYGAGYRYRLAPLFDPPYRAYRIAQLLHARTRYDAAYFERMQLDTASPPELELARLLVARGGDGTTVTALRELARWNGRFEPGSRAATIVHSVRAELESGAPSLVWLLAQLRHAAPGAAIDNTARGALYEAGTHAGAWGNAGAVAVDHPLAPLRFGFLNGDTLPGQGDEYTIRLQEPGFAQSFRAVWKAGDWNAGGIAIPSGESGIPGSPHYTDLTPAWIAGRLEPLPFGASAVRRAQRSRLVLLPGQR